MQFGLYGEISFAKMCVKNHANILRYVSNRKKNALAICVGISYTFLFPFARHSMMI